MFLFKKNPKSFLGIDVGASAVKLVELGKEKGRFKLINYAIAPLSDYLKKVGSQSDSELLNADSGEIAEVIKEAIKEAKITARDAYFSIPAYSSFSTLIDFPNMPEKEIAAAVPLEARKHIPVPVSELVLDWNVMDLPGKQSGRQAMVIAAPKKVIDTYTQISKLAGLVSRGMEEETFSLGRALVGNDKSVMVLVDVGARSINIGIVDGGYIRVVHDLEMGGVKVTQAIAQQMNLDLEKAENLKKEMSGEGEQFSRLKGVGYSTLGAIIVEIRKIIEAYQSKYSRRVEKCILVGDGIRLVGFADYLTTKLSIDVSLGNPFARVFYPPELAPILKEIGPPLAVAVGLSMRG
ncbi:type IV pilus assembly protein PilM [Patescibacteria group bacterium]|nr:type IV pilus assembly protein PilM [Patescibacteria group bacterium]